MLKFQPLLKFTQCCNSIDSIKMSFSFATFGITCESKINKRCQLILMTNKLESGSVHLPDYKRKKLCLTIPSKGLVKCRKEVEGKTD